MHNDPANSQQDPIVQGYVDFLRQRLVSGEVDIQQAQTLLAHYSVSLSNVEAALSNLRMVQDMSAMSLALVELYHQSEAVYTGLIDALLMHLNGVSLHVPGAQRLAPGVDLRDGYQDKHINK